MTVPVSGPVSEQRRAAGTFALRRAGVQDVPAVVSLFDDAIAWLVSRGSEGQWGREPWSSNPARIERVRGWCLLPGAWVAHTGSGELAGALVLSSAPNYVPALTEGEVYVLVLIGSRRPEARGVGRFLLRFAEQEARAAGVDLLRVDCWAGGGGALVRFYESAGFRRTTGFQVGDWQGQVLEKRVPRTSAGPRS